MPPPVLRSTVRSIVPLLAGLFLASLALRTQVIGVGPLIPAIQADLGISHGVAGLLGTIPVLCMGLFAPLGPRLANSFGPRVALAISIGLIVGFGLVRAVVPGIVPVILVTVGIGIGLGTAGPILAILVRLRAPDHPALATGAYAGGIVLSGTFAAATAVPIAGPGGDWRLALAVFAAAGMASLLGVFLIRADRPADRAAATSPRLTWPTRTGWILGLVFGLQSALYYGIVAWLPSLYVERGWSEVDAAALLAIVHGVGLFATIGLPLVSDRLGPRRDQLTIASSVALVGFVGVALLPDLAPAWVVLLGLSLGAIFPLVLTLPIDVADHAREVGSIAASMLLLGYGISSLAPVVLGLARDAAGDFGAAMALLVAMAAVLTIVCRALLPGRRSPARQHAPA